MPESGHGTVTRIYDFYGSPDADSKRVSEFIAHALGVAFTPRVSSDRGDYFVANGPAGEEIVVEQNEAEDEDGTFLRQPDDAGYPTLILAWHKAADEQDAAAVLGQLRDRLGTVGGLVFLRRRQSAKPARRPGQQ
ncbi:MAG: hypothetical protein WAK82_22525 [Streptosporangiaceae bacterium]